MPWIPTYAGRFDTLTMEVLASFPNAQIPQIFIRGDGHRTPPFNWATRYEVRGYFVDRMVEGNLCLHVEQQPEEVDPDSVPPLFVPAYAQGKVFGWELSIYRELQPAMRLCLKMMGVSLPYLVDIVELDRLILRAWTVSWKVNNPAWMREYVKQSSVFLEYWKKRHADIKERKPATEDDYVLFLVKFNNSCMEFRCASNHLIAANIMRKISEFPHATHLIAIGDAHLTSNPVQNFMAFGPQFGLIDRSQG